MHSLLRPAAQHACSQGLSRRRRRRSVNSAAAAPAGVNTAIYSPSGANSGVGFAIPVDIVRSSAEQIILFGKARRGGAVQACLLREF